MFVVWCNFTHRIVLQQVRIAHYPSFGERTILVRMTRCVLQSREYVNCIQERVLGIDCALSKTRVASDAHLLRNNSIGEIAPNDKDLHESET